MRICRACNNYVVGRNELCRACNSIFKNIEYKYFKVITGNCFRCRKELDREGVYCTWCANQLRIKSNTRSEMRRHEGLCVGCGVPIEGLSYCRSCLDRRMERYYKKKNKKSESEE